MRPPDPGDPWHPVRPASMRSIPLLLFIAALTGLSVLPGATARAQAPAPRAHNPILWADVPDPSVIRVDSVYYMTSTTMHLSPGVPIMKSTNLVDWHLVGYAYDVMANADALNMRGGQNAYGRGSWASSLRYHGGTFYVATFSYTTGETYVFTTGDIEHGPWHKASLGGVYHDPSLFFDDDGRTYLVYGAGDLRLLELTADARAVKQGGVDRVLLREAGRLAGEQWWVPGEGSQLFQVDGRYYLFLIVWPAGGMRTQVVYRAERLDGPWEGRVVLQDAGIAQGGIVDTPEGDWYALLFGDRGAVGRIPYLVPMTWADGWPVLGVDGKVPETLDIPTGAQGASGVSGIVASDEFERAPGEPDLPLAWQWNHNPDDAHWALLPNPGRLRLTTGRRDDALVDARNTLTQRTFGPTSSATTALDVSGMKDGDYAGLAALASRYGFVGARMEGGEKRIVMVQVQADSLVEVEGPRLAGDRVFLRIDADFEDQADRAFFYYSFDGDGWTRIGEPLQMVYTLEHFMGYRFGLFNFATQEAGGFVDFDYFRLGDTIHAPD